MAPFSVMAHGLGPEPQAGAADQSAPTAIEQALIEHACNATPPGRARKATCTRYVSAPSLSHYAPTSAAISVGFQPPTGGRSTRPVARSARTGGGTRIWTASARSSSPCAIAGVVEGRLRREATALPLPSPSASAPSAAPAAPLAPAPQASPSPGVLRLVDRRHPFDRVCRCGRCVPGHEGATCATQVSGLRHRCSGRRRALPEMPA